MQEIVENLLPGQRIEDRPDLATRVFKGYMDAFTNELYKDGIMGRHVSHCHVVEFQVDFRNNHLAYLLFQQNDAMTAYNYTLCFNVTETRFATLSYLDYFGPRGSNSERR